MPPARRHRLQKLVHFLTAFTVGMKGLSKLDHPEGMWPVILFLFATSIYITAVTLLHDRLHAHEIAITASIYALESVVTAIVATLYRSEGKTGLQMVTGLASLLFAIAFVVHLVRGRRGGVEHRHDEPQPAARQIATEAEAASGIGEVSDADARKPEGLVDRVA